MTDEQRIYHILEGIQLIETFLEGSDYNDFMVDDKLKYACYGVLVTIAEATTKVSKGTKEKLNNVEWALISKFRNIIIHEYFRIEWDVLWDVIKANLPVLKKELQNYK